MKKKDLKFKKIISVSLIIVFTFSFLNLNLLVKSENSKVIAASNLISGGSFEGNIDNDWFIWQSENYNRDYSFSRSYDVDFGVGSYSAVINATEEAKKRWDAGLITLEHFPIDANYNYYFVFHAKASSEVDISVFLSNASTYEGITPGIDKKIGTEWKKYVILLSPSSGANAFASFVFGDLPAGTSLHLDGVQIFKSDLEVLTEELKGFVGNSNKVIKISNLGNFNKEDVQIELPYMDNLTGQTTTKKFAPDKITTSGAYISFHKKTYSGTGKVYINDNSIGTFDYNVSPQIKDFYPSMLRAGEDLTIVGGGFTPSGSNTFLVLNAIDQSGKTVENWIPADSIDSDLSQAIFKLPAGITKGKMYLYTSYLNNKGEEVEGKSNTLSYGVKPVISDIKWSKKGYEQVGDKLKIYGKGFSARPYVNFYDDDGNKIDTKSAELIEVGEYEVIEVEASDSYNNSNIKVMAYGIESDDLNSVSYLAKPRFEKIVSKYKRRIQSTDMDINATKIGETIKLIGNGFRSTNGDVSVEFQGLNERIIVPITEDKISSNGRNIEVEVPLKAQNGHININANGEKSNYIPLEIVPVVLSVNPDPIVPGEDILIKASGVGPNMEMTRLHFVLDKNNHQYVKPESITYDGDYATVRAKSPLAVSSNDTYVSLEYGNWSDEGKLVLNVNPVITKAAINMDDKILSIRGYGFGINSRENEITFKHADENKSTIQPRVKMLGVYPTEEGQEIRVQILDEYHYGYVQVKVGDKISDEINFGPISVARISRRVEHVKSINEVKGVLYINGYNFGSDGGVKIGDHWADIHYRTDFLIIAVIDKQYINDNPVIVTK